MNKTGILFEPLPIARIGIVKDTEEFAIINDFSAFSQMLEEYIGFGAVDIVIPSSSPEKGLVEQMPLTLQSRIKIIDDTREWETVIRLLSNIRNEFSIKIHEETHSLLFPIPKKIPSKLFDSIDSLHYCLNKLALGFNYGIQIGFNIQNSIQAIRYIRGMVSDSNSRLILAQIEGLLSQYEEVQYEGLIPLKKEPAELVSIFDKLINDQTYLDYSNSISQLSEPAKREHAINNIKILSRSIASKKYFASGWDYLTKVVNVISGVPLPEYKAISTIISGKKLPQLVNFSKARHNALEMWKISGNTNRPLQRNGIPIDARNIYWLPPWEGLTPDREDYKSSIFIRKEDIINALENLQKQKSETANRSEDLI